MWGLEISRRLRYTFAMKFFVVLLAIIALLTTFWVAKDFIVFNKQKDMPSGILKTNDGISIAYDFYSVDNPQKWFILIHMMPETKESWKDFAQMAQTNGFASLAIDLRGHGQSEGGPDGYNEFSDADHQKSILDLQAAAAFLKEKNVDPEKVVFVGASIGANLVLQFLSENSEYKKAILLSPGLDYRGIKTEPLVKNLKKGQSVWYLAAQDDDRSGGNAGDMVKKLYELTPGQVIRLITIFKIGGHGTDLFNAVPELKNKILEWSVD